MPATEGRAGGERRELVEFAAAASHDLGAPLRLITGYLEILAEHVDQGDPEVEASLNRIRQGTDRLQAMVEGLLAFVRSGDELEVDQVDSGEVVQGVLEVLGPEIEESGIEIRVAELPEVFANRGQLNQLFQNLIANAIKFRADKNPKISIEAVEQPGVWQFTVADNGIGIAGPDQLRIFDLFGRSRAVRELGGSGIGLSVARRIAEAHGGSIWVDSAPGHGSSFHFTLPVALRRSDDPAIRGSQL